MAIIPDLLAPSVVTGIVSRVKTPGNFLLKYFGMDVGGKNVNQVSGRSYSWDIFDHTRAIAKGRAPDTGPATIPRNPVGRQTNTFPRSYEKLRLSYEVLNNIRALGQNAGQKDKMGARYVEQQARYIKQRTEHFRSFELAMLLTQGTMSFRYDGDDWVPVASLGANLGFTVDYLVPAGNKSAAIPGLNPLGTSNIIDASWATAGTNIPLHISQINKAFQSLVGAPLALAITDSTVWEYLKNNTKLQAQGGSVNAVFSEYTMEQVTGPDGNKLGIFKAVLRAFPWLTWLIVDEGLDVDGTYTPFFDGTKVTFMIEPDPYWLAMQEGSEIVKESPWSPASERFGPVSWIREWDEPANVELHCLSNQIPELRIPKGIMQVKVAA